jgi:DNA (cytosine-5)-methyltransferase 1
VFVVGYLGDWRAAAAVLFERHSLSGHPAPSREKRESAAANAKEGADVSDYHVAGTLDKGIPGRGIGHNGNYDSQVVSRFIGIASGSDPELMSTLCAKDNEKWGCNQWVNEGKAVIQPIALAENTIGRQPQNGGNGDGFTDGGPMYTLNATGGHGVAQPTIVHGTQDPCVSDIAFAQGRNNGGENVMVQSMAVRRLSPKECERLQGFGDNYTDIKSKGKPTPDGPRYKALGNSMAVPVMAWIGQRIQEVEAICKQNK